MTVSCIDLQLDRMLDSCCPTFVIKTVNHPSAHPSHDLPRPSSLWRRLFHRPAPPVEVTRARRLLQGKLGRSARPAAGRSREHVTAAAQESARGPGQAG